MEVWKDINLTGIYPYQISSKGRVKALFKVVEHSNGKKRRYPELILSQRIDGKGYPFVSLYGQGIKVIQIRVHQLVAMAFIPNSELKPCVNHKDGVRTNNHKDNLEWCTYSENTADAIKRRVVWNPSKKISQEDVESIRRLWKSGQHRQHQIAKIFNIGQSQVSRIVNNINWTVLNENNTGT